MLTSSWARDRRSSLRSRSCGSSSSMRSTNHRTSRVRRRVTTRETSPCSWLRRTVPLSSSAARAPAWNPVTAATQVDGSACSCRRESRGEGFPT